MPILGMLHLKGGSPANILERAIRESDIMCKAGVDAVVVEDYFGSADDAERVLEWLSANRCDKIYGVNILHDFPRSYELAEHYGARFMQVDSVAGHLRQQDDTSYGEMIAGYRADGSVFVLGGVRFKYQPYLSGRWLVEDLEIGRTRCNAIVVTGEGTDMVTDTQKSSIFVVKERAMPYTLLWKHHAGAVRQAARPWRERACKMRFMCRKTMTISGVSLMMVLRCVIGAFYALHPHKMPALPA